MSKGLTASHDGSEDSHMDIPSPQEEGDDTSTEKSSVSRDKGKGRAKHAKEASSDLERPHKCLREGPDPDVDSPEPTDLVYFDPASLVSAKVGTFKAPSDM